MNATRNRLVDEYLRRLDRALHDLPSDRRGEIMQEIQEHIEQALSELGSPNEAEVRGLIDRMGEPEDIAAEARASLGFRPPRARALEVAALVLLAVGGLTALVGLVGGVVLFWVSPAWVIVPVVGWVVGVVLLWVSPSWTWRDKLVGTLLIPGGLFTPLAVGLGAGLALPVGVGELVLLFLLAAPIASVAFLAWRLRRGEPVAG
jgi:uncharacterized membrane protein